MLREREIAMRQNPMNMTMSHGPEAYTEANLGYEEGVSEEDENTFNENRKRGMTST